MTGIVTAFRDVAVQVCASVAASGLTHEIGTIHERPNANAWSQNLTLVALVRLASSTSSAARAASSACALAWSALFACSRLCDAPAARSWSDARVEVQGGKDGPVPAAACRSSSKRLPAAVPIDWIAVTSWAAFAEWSFDASENANCAASSSAWAARSFQTRPRGGRVLRPCDSTAGLTRSSPARATLSLQT